MIIKKFTAETETEAILMAKEEMGPQAVVLNIKKVKHKGLARFFKKDTAEVTAALEETPQTPPITSDVVKEIAKIARVDEEENEDKKKAGEREEKGEKTTAIEEKLNNLQNMLENQMKKDRNTGKEEEKKKQEEEDTNVKFMKLVYNQLIESEVDEKYANQIIGEVQSSLKKESSMDTMLSCIYQKIILKLGEPKPIVLKEGKKQIVFFVGPTGVGKTTTIAKLASDFKLNKKANIALITSDTYRIAAVEQLRTYANILDVKLQVVYTIGELNQAVMDFADFDLILVDTAGRSHNNREQCEEMLQLIRQADVEDLGFEKNIYVVLSASTKYKDLLKITDVYKDLAKYQLIFTKLDETSGFGNILNLRLKTQSSLSYITAGQGVPDDISLIEPQKMAKRLLGGNETQ